MLHSIEYIRSHWSALLSRSLSYQGAKPHGCYIVITPIPSSQFIKRVSRGVLITSPSVTVLRRSIQEFFCFSLYFKRAGSNLRLLSFFFNFLQNKKTAWFFVRNRLHGSCRLPCMICFAASSLADHVRNLRMLSIFVNFSFYAYFDKQKG